MQRGRVGDAGMEACCCSCLCGELVGKDTQNCSDMYKSTPYPLPEAPALQAKLLMALQERGVCPADECGRRSADSGKVAVCTLCAWEVGVEAGVAVLVRQTMGTLHTSTTV